MFLRFDRLADVSLGLPMVIFATMWERLLENEADRGDRDTHTERHHWNTWIQTCLKPFATGLPNI